MIAKAAVIVVNYRTADLAIACLRALATEVAALPSTRAVVVDNASGDGSAQRIEQAISAEGWKTWASLLALEENQGFSAGNNAGIRLLLRDQEPPEWFLLLNPDTVIRPGALQALLERAEMGPRTGIVGSRLEDTDGSPQRSAFRFPSVASEFDRGLRLGVVSRLLARWNVVLPPREVACKADWVCGASMLIRRAVLDRVGLLDDGYFLYHEETDFCLRAARAGWECWYEPRSRVVHLVHKSTGFDPIFPVRRLPAYVFESRRRYFVKNHGVLYAGMADLAWIIGHLCYLVRMHLQRRRVDVAPGAFRDFLRHSVLLGGILG